nr:hypothetical protein [Glycomyces sp. NRRL B-16210]
MPPPLRMSTPSASTNGPVGEVERPTVIWYVEFAPAQQVPMEVNR